MYSNYVRYILVYYGPKGSQYYTGSGWSPYKTIALRYDNVASVKSAMYALRRSLSNPKGLVYEKLRG